MDPDEELTGGYRENPEGTERDGAGTWKQIKDTARHVRSTKEFTNNKSINYGYYKGFTVSLSSLSRVC